jgi:hypothetical protein
LRKQIATLTKTGDERPLTELEHVRVARSLWENTLESRIGHLCLHLPDDLGDQLGGI